MPGGNKVAVKLVESAGLSSTLDVFVKEVALVTRLNHRNLVNLKGCCLHEHQWLLVYEFVDNLDVYRILLDRGLSGKSSHFLKLYLQLLSWLLLSGMWQQHWTPCR